MIQLTLGQVIGRNPFLTKRMLAIQSLLNSIGVDRTAFSELKPHHPVTFIDAAMIWSFGAVVSRGLVAQDGMMVLLQRYRDQFISRAEDWEQLYETENGLDSSFAIPLILVLVDRRYARITPLSDDAYYDLVQCQTIEAEKLPPVFEGVSYNLAVPVKNEFSRTIKEAQDATDRKAERHNPGSADASNRIAGARWRTVSGGVPKLGPRNDQDGAGGSYIRKATAGQPEQADGGDRAGDE